MALKLIDCKSACVSTTGTLRSAVDSLNISGLKIVLVTNQENMLVGTISDGDIRRAILKNLALDSSVDLIMNKNPITATISDSEDFVRQQMSTYKIHQIPIVNHLMELKGLHIWNQIRPKTRLSNKMIVMAGGKGTRLYPQTENCPKPMLRINGKPILELILGQAIESGFGEFIFSTNYLSEQIESHFGDGSQFGVNIRYYREDFPLGTGGSLRGIDIDPGFATLLTNGDVLTKLDYSTFLDFHNSQDSKLSIAVRLSEWKSPFGVIELDQDIVKNNIEKPTFQSYINAGIYALSPGIKDYFPKGAHFDMSELISNLLRDGIKVSAYPIHEEWLDVGTPIDFQTATTMGSNH